MELSQHVDEVEGGGTTALGGSSAAFSGPSRTTPSTKLMT
jgi:hypothetical protein